MSKEEKKLWLFISTIVGLVSGTLAFQASHIQLQAQVDTLQKTCRVADILERGRGE